MVSHHTMTDAQKQSIMREVLEDHISPNELAKRYNIRAYAIREWIKKAGHALPKNYKRFDRHLFPSLDLTHIISLNGVAPFCSSSYNNNKQIIFI